jgi:hypothetical protein
MINILNSVNPIGVWRQSSSAQNNKECETPLLTYGWNQFNQKILTENLTLDIIKNPAWQIDFNIRLGYRYPLTIGKYNVFDGMVSLFRKLKIERLNMNDFSLHQIQKNITVVTNKKYDLHNAKLRFTAPDKHRGNILSGKQPLRSTAFYRSILNKNRPSADMTEGTRSVSILLDEVSGIRSGYIRNITKTILPCESHIFSLHDIHANTTEISKFGNDTYEIINLPKWISCIVHEVNRYWRQKKNTYVGTFVYFGKIEYTNEKKIETLHSISDLSDEWVFQNPDMNYKVDGLGFIRQEIHENLADDCINYHFKKSKDYSGESEHRLCIIPLYSDCHGDGPIYFDNNDFEISMEIKNYKKFIKLI